MAELTVSQRGLVALMAESAQNAAQGFSLLASYERPHDFFDELASAGLFAPQMNPAPRPTDKPDGGLYLPYWPALGYLINVGKVASTERDVALGDKLMAVVRAIGLYKDAEGKSVDNYYTSSAAAEIAGLVPPECVRLDDIELVATWLSGGWSNDGIVKELDDGLFSSHLREPTPASIEKLARLLEISTALRLQTPPSPGGDEGFEQKPDTVADAYWLERLLDHHGAALGRLVGGAAVSCLVRRSGEAFGAGKPANLSWLTRPAIEDHEQNPDWDYVRGAFVRSAREALQAWLVANPEPARAYVREMIRSPSQIIRRLALHTCRLNWQILHGVFFDALGQDLFQPEHLHELYLLLSEHFPDMTPDQKHSVLDTVSAIGQGCVGEEAERARHRQLRWLHAIRTQGYPPADVAYAAVATDLGPIGEHPEFLSYHQVSWGPGPSPYDASELIAAVADGRLVQLVDGLTTQDHPLRSPRRALLDTVSEAVSQAPRDFLQYLEWNQPTSRRLQYALLSGFGKTIKKAYEEKRKDEAEFLVDPLLRAHDSLLSQKEFWTEAVEEDFDLEPTRNWIPPIAVEFVDWLCNKDDLTFNSERKALSMSIVRATLTNAEGLADADDALTAAINDTRGKGFDAYLALLLRTCRDADKRAGDHEAEWHEFRPFIEAELDRDDSGGYEVYALLGSHIQQLIYVDAEWLVANAPGIFPSDDEKFRAAVIGLGYASASQRLYSILTDSSVPSRVLFESRVSGSARERILERVALSYMWGQEPLEGDVIGRLFGSDQFDDILELARTIGRWTDQELTADQRSRALALGARCAEFAAQAPTARSILLAEVAEYVGFQIPPDPRDLEWLQAAASHVTEHHGLYRFMDSVVKVAEADPEAALRLMQALARGRPPSYDHEERIERTLRLIAKGGFRLEAIRLIDAMSSSHGVLPTFMPLYEDLLASNPDN